MPSRDLFHSLRDKVEAVSGWRIRAEFPFGNEKFRDLRRSLPDLQVRHVLDVGANIGQSAVQFRKVFPEAVIHSFEPVGSTVEIFKRNVDDALVHVHQLALGAAPGRVEMQVSRDAGTSDMNSIGRSHPFLHDQALTKEVVEMTTLDLWCATARIEEVDFLKIDTEGHDLEVLKGAEGLLARQAIGLIDIEVGMNPTNTFHAPFSAVSEFLWSHGMLLFGIYDQLQEAPGTGCVLRRVNAMFISPKLAMPLSEGPKAPSTR